MVEDNIELLNIDFQFLVLVALAWASSSMVEVTLIQFSFLPVASYPAASFKMRLRDLYVSGKAVKLSCRRRG